MKLDSALESMSGASRISLVVVLCTIVTGTLFAAGAFRNWMEKWIPSAEIVVALHALCLLGVWLVPLLFSQIRKQISVRLTWTWTVLAIAPLTPLMNGIVAAFPASGTSWPSMPWVLYICLLASGISSGILEEVIFRGYAFLGFPERHPKLVVLTTAFCFSLLHFLNLVLLDHSLSVVVSTAKNAFVVGIAYGVIRIVSGGIGWPLLLHSVNNAIAFILPEATGKAHLGLSFAIFSVCLVATTAAFFGHPKMRATHRERRVLFWAKPTAAIAKDLGRGLTRPLL